MHVKWSYIGNLKGCSSEYVFWVMTHDGHFKVIYTIYLHYT